MKTSGHSKITAGRKHEPLFEALGEAIHIFSWLSNNVQFGIGLLLFGRELNWGTTEIVTAELSFRRSVELFSCLYRHRFPKQKHDQLKRICKKLFDAETERNKLMHFKWGILVDEPEYAVRIKATAKERGLRWQFQRMTLPEITRIVDQLSQTSQELLKFISGDQLTTWDAATRR